MRRLTQFFVVLAALYTTSVQAADRLGIALQQGYDYPHVSYIDPFGPGAASGLMVGDRIKEIGNRSVWYTYQVKALLSQANKTAPFTMVIERNGTLHSLQISFSKPAKKWPIATVHGQYGACFFKPTRRCIAESLDNPSSYADLNKRFGRSYTYVKTLAQLGDMKRARQAQADAEVTLYRLPEFSSSNAAVLIDQMQLVGAAPGETFFNFVVRNLDKTDLADNLNMARAFKKSGNDQAALNFFGKSLRIARSDPKKLQSRATLFGRVLAAFGRHDLLTEYLEADGFKPRWKDQLIEAAIIHHLKAEDFEGTRTALNIMTSAKRSRTDRTQLRMIRLFTKMQRPDYAQRIISNIEKAAKKPENQTFMKSSYAASLIRAYAASGKVSNAVAILDRDFKTSLKLHIQLVVEAAESKSAYGVAAQFYPRLPPLIQRTTALYQQNKTTAGRQLLTVNTRNFLQVSASTAKLKPDFNMFQAIDASKYDAQKIIEALAAVRRQPEALSWADWAERRFGKVYTYGKIFRSAGSSGTQKLMDALSQHPKYSQYGQGMLHHHMYRLYWNGRIEQAIEVFAKLSAEEQRRAVLRQVHFVRKCNECTL